MLRVRVELRCQIVLHFFQVCAAPLLISGRVHTMSSLSSEASAASSVAVDDLLRFSKPSASFTDSVSMRRIDKLCEISKQLLDKLFSHVISAHSRGRCSVVTYSSDGTPLLMNRAWTKMLGARILTRYGKSCSEFLVQQAFIKGRAEDGPILSAVRIRDPVPLTSKLGWSLFACMTTFSPTLRSLGYKGASSFARCLRQGGAMFFLSD